MLVHRANLANRTEKFVNVQRKLEKMVVDLCLPHFYTTVQCSKLCADGYDVTNLVSADPALRRRGFKLEYFLRPPVQVTLKFGFKVELCRVDVELWPWGMDLGQACKRLEISTSSDQLPSQETVQGHKQVEQKQKDWTEQKREKQKDNRGKSKESKGHQWSLQAQQWGKQTSDEPRQRDFASKCHSKTESGNPEVDFKLVGRCELREETKVSFTRSNFRPRPPFLSQPPPQPAGHRQEELWNRGLLSLTAVTQLRVTVPFGGAASAMGLKALVVWGQPSSCCSAEEVERIKRVHEASLPHPVLFAPSVSQKKIQLQETSIPSNVSIPEEFLDPITQEVMLLPMLLPGGVSVDHTTLEEHQKREATWGRPPNDPFTGVPFTSTSRPLPNPQLKSRIDHFLLQRGMMRREGILGGQGEVDSPQASRLVASKDDGPSKSSPCVSESSKNNSVIQDKDTHRIAKNKDCVIETKSELEKGKKRDLSEISKESSDVSIAEKKLLPQTKRPRNDAVSMSNCSSHEQRLSASLDEALFSALQGRPSFTSNLSQQRQVPQDSDPNTAGEKRCSACSRSVSAYSQSASSVYRLACKHLLCGSCLRRGPQQMNSDGNNTSNHIVCRVCQCLTPRTEIIRVHH